VGLRTWGRPELHQFTLPTSALPQGCIYKREASIPILSRAIFYFGCAINT